MILSIGEILADMIGENENGITKYSRYAGGAPLNVAVGIKRLGGKVGFIGTVGNDIIGRFLKEFTDSINFDYIDLHLDNNHNTTLAFVDINENGERDFQFNRFNTADYFYDKKRLEVIKDFDIIHLGSLMLSENEGRATADYIIKLTKKYNKKLSFDVNFRSDIYDSIEDAKKIYLKYIKAADILKFSEDEIELFTGLKDYKEGLKNIVSDNQMVFVTLGSKGSYFKYKNIEVYKETQKIKPVDTTGAGDAFYASSLYLLDELKEDINENNIKDILDKSNKNGALACLKKGAL